MDREEVRTAAADAPEQSGGLQFASAVGCASQTGKQRAALRGARAEKTAAFFLQPRPVHRVPEPPGNFTERTGEAIAPGDRRETARDTGRARALRANRRGD